MSLSPDVAAKYSAIIDAILSTSDLNTISAKQIRKGLQAAVDYDITPQKNAITELIMERFDNFFKEKDKTTASTPVKPEPTTNDNTTPNSITTNSFGLTLPSRALNGDHKQRRDMTSAPSNTFSPGKKRHNPAADDENHDQNHEESFETSDAGISSPAKKPRKSKAAEEDDAAFAARLQAQENSLARSTRGSNGTKRRSAVNKATPKKNKKTKSAKKVKDDDESGLETGSGVEKKEVKRTGGFHKPMNLSPALSTLLEEEFLSRPQTVKKVWQYIKANDLQDPSDKRQIRCDDAMRAVFKQDRVHMFTMNKILNENLYPRDEE